MANKGKQAPALVPIGTTARGESTTVLALSSQQKDWGSLMQKAFLFASFFFPSPFQQKHEQRIQFYKGCHLSYGHTSTHQWGDNWKLQNFVKYVVLFTALLGKKTSRYKYHCQQAFIPSKIPTVTVSTYKIKKHYVFACVFVGFFNHSVHIWIHLRSFTVWVNGPFSVSSATTKDVFKKSRVLTKKKDSISFIFK